MIGELWARGCTVELDDGVTIEGFGDIDTLRLWREREPGLKRKWQSDDPKKWEGVMFSGDR